MNLALKAITAVTIPPLYYMGERTNLLRGTPFRGPVQHALRTMSASVAFTAKRAFYSAEATGENLPADRIDEMLARVLGKQTRKDRRTPEEKTIARAQEVLSGAEAYLPRRAQALELACGDCGVGEQLHLAGHRVTGIDLRIPARKPIVKFEQMDAASLSFPTGSFDLVYSFDAFEHFSDPAAVLRETYRVLRPGGIFYASFGPLYHSPQGAHQWFSLDFPYAHMLFSRDDLNAAADRLGRLRLTPNLNFWSLTQFRELLDSNASRFQTLHRFEKYNVSFVDRVIENPQCFRGKVNDFDEIVVRSIEVMLRKKG